MKILIKDIVKACGGRFLWGNEDGAIEAISLDSRHMEGKDLFVPIAGEKVDAHRFICQALSLGAAAVLTNVHRSSGDVKEELEKFERGGGDARAIEDRVWIGVEDTRRALQDLGAWRRKQISIPIIGVTGSVGKTTTREMIAQALSAGLRVFRTPGNLNSQVGVPITICSIPEDAQAAVIELGMSEPGEMERIAKVAQVDCGVVTNIGVAHIGQLGSRERIMEEKLKIQEGMNPQGTLFLNGDDDLLQNASASEGRRTVYFGTSPRCRYRAEDIRLEEGHPVFTAVCGEKRIPMRLSVLGLHMISGALAAMAVADFCGVDLEGAASSLEQFCGYKGRQQIYEVGKMTVVDDSYNASPASMIAGLQVLESLKPGARTIAILADMKALGPEEVRFHREIGYYIAAHPVDRVVLLGELAREIGRGILEKGGNTSVEFMGNLDQVKDFLSRETKEGDCILFKGSNSMRLGDAVSWFRQKLEEA